MDEGRERLLPTTVQQVSYFIDIQRADGSITNALEYVHKKYHKTSYYCLQQDLQEDVDEIGNDSGNNDCIVSLPGELDEGTSDDENEGGSNKWQWLFGV